LRCTTTKIYYGPLALGHDQAIQEDLFWGIRQTKGHDQSFKKTSFGFERSLPYICLFYWDFVVVRIYINLVEVLGSLELVKKAINSVSWVLVLDYDFV
jgi:hypothetical protein